MNDLQTRSEASASVAGGGAKVRKKSLFREYAEAIIIAVLLALVIRQFAVQAFTIPSGSMMDTLLIGDYILVNKFLLGPEIPFTDKHLPGLRSPEHGDVIVFKYPNDETRDFIKRIVAVGGDTIQVKDNRVWRNGTLIEEPYVMPGSFRSGPVDPLRLPLRLRAARRAAELVFRHGRQPGQLAGQPLLGLRQAREDPRQGLPDLLVVERREPLAALASTRHVLALIGGDLDGPLRGLRRRSRRSTRPNAGH